jgi:hypothetical protein
MLHEGQLTGAKIKVPVQLSRRPVEEINREVLDGYEAILFALEPTSVGKGRASILRPRAAWADNPTGLNFIVVQWQTKGPDFDLVVVNLAPHPSQCYVTLDIQELATPRRTRRTCFISAPHGERQQRISWK